MKRPELSDEQFQAILNQQHLSLVAEQPVVMREQLWHHLAMECLFWSLVVGVTCVLAVLIHRLIDIWGRG